MTGFKLQSPYLPAGDQPQAIEKLVSGIEENMEHQVLMGITGSGKTFTMANVIQSVQKPRITSANNAIGGPERMGTKQPIKLIHNKITPSTC